MASTKSRKKARRPGHPRKTKDPNRLTLRIDRLLADRMNAQCEATNITQREFVEGALTVELAKPQPDPTDMNPSVDLYRTGMWIDPALVKALDKLIEKEGRGTTQRAVLERAIRRSLAARA